MNRSTRTLNILFMALLTASVTAGQQKQAPPETLLKENASLEETLSWLDAKLRYYGRFTLYHSSYEPGSRDRTRFLGLHAEGCMVTYRVSHELLSSGRGTDSGAVTYRPIVPPAVTGNQVTDRTGSPAGRVNGDGTRFFRDTEASLGAGGGSVRELTVNLAALNPALVRGETPKRWDGGRVIFGAGIGNKSVKIHHKRYGTREYEGGEFYVSEEGAVDGIAKALRRAVEICRATP